MAAESQFWSDVSTKYDSVVDAQLGRHLRSLIRDRLSQERELGRALEIGCGSGLFTPTIADRADSVVATDIADGMLAIAQRALSGRDNVSFQVEDCQKTSFPDSTFDSAFMALVLQFVDADTTLREMHRVLKPGGALLIANLDVFALGIPLRILLVARTLYYAKVKYNRGMPRVTAKRLLSAAQLRGRLETAGFRVTCLEPIRDRSCAYNCPVNYVRALKE